MWRAPVLPLGGWGFKDGASQGIWILTSTAQHKALLCVLQWGYFPTKPREGSFASHGGVSDLEAEQEFARQRRDRMDLSRGETRSQGSDLWPHTEHLENGSFVTRSWGGEERLESEVGKLTGGQISWGLEMSPTSSFRQWEDIPRAKVHMLGML